MNQNLVTGWLLIFAFFWPEKFGEWIGIIIKAIQAVH